MYTVLKNDEYWIFDISIYLSHVEYYRNIMKINTYQFYLVEPNIGSWDNNDGGIIVHMYVHICCWY